MKVECQCPSCLGLTIEQLILFKKDGGHLRLSYDEYYINFSGGINIKSSDFKYGYNFEILIDGKFDMEKVRTHEFWSKEMFDELEKERSTENYKKSYNELDRILNGFKEVIKDRIVFEDSHGNIWDINMDNELEFNSDDKSIKFKIGIH